MQALYATAIAAALLTVTPALAAGDSSIDVGELSCAQFTAYDNDNRGCAALCTKESRWQQRRWLLFCVT